MIYNCVLHTFDDQPLFSLSVAPSILVLQWLRLNKELIFLVKSIRRVEIHIKDPPLPGNRSLKQAVEEPRGKNPVRWWQQYWWPCQGLHTHSFGCCIGPQSKPARGWDLAGVSRGPQRGRTSLSACQHCSSHRCLVHGLGKHSPKVEKGTLWGNVFTFSILWRTVVSRSPSPTAHLFSPGCSPPCLHPSRDSISSGHRLTLSILPAPRS